MLITVIVPIYNMEAYLCTSLDRLLQQSFQDYEILLIDDGSKDSSGEICDRYAREHSRIRVVHKPNGGSSTARNAGIEHARGEYLTFCDPDDWVDADYLQQFVEAGMDEHTLPVTGILQHREGKSDRRLTAPAMDVQGQACTEAIVALRRHDMLGFTVNKLLVKRIIDENGLRFIEGLSHREDEIFLLQYIPHVSRIVINEKTPYHYRVLGSGLSKKRKPTELILRVSRQLHDLFLQAAPTPEGRYVAARIGYNNAAKRSRRRKRTRSCILPRKRPAMPAKSIFRPSTPRFSPTAGIGKSQPAAGGSSPSELSPAGCFDASPD